MPPLPPMLSVQTEWPPSGSTQVPAEQMVPHTGSVLPQSPIPHCGVQHEPAEVPVPSDLHIWPGPQLVVMLQNLPQPMLVPHGTVASHLAGVQLHIIVFGLQVYVSPCEGVPHVLEPEHLPPQPSSAPHDLPAQLATGSQQPYLLVVLDLEQIALPPQVALLQVPPHPSLSPHCLLVQLG
jgi:hypothetical protein